MKNRPLSRITRLAGMTAGAVLALAVSAHAAIKVAYTPDADTLHLWHLDDPAGSLTLTDAVPNNPIVLTNSGSPLSTLGVPASTESTNLNWAVSNTAKTHVLYGGTFADVSQFWDIRGI